VTYSHIEATVISVPVVVAGAASVDVLVCVSDTFVAVLGIGSDTAGTSATRITVADPSRAVDSVPAAIADTRTVVLSMSIAHTVDAERWASQSVAQWLLSGEASNTDWVTELSPDAAVMTTPFWFADA
jgi:predicted transcriptional regulator